MAEDRHAISGYAFIINGGTVSWSAKRQEIISLSTTESEYIAATHALREALWLHPSSGFVPSFNNFLTSNCPLLPCIPTTSLQLPSPKTISIMLGRNTLTFGITSFTGLSNKGQSGSFIALPMIWLLTHSPNLSLQLKSNFLLLNSDLHYLEGECWISKDKL